MTVKILKKTNAIAYAEERGWRVFPVKPDAKTPLIKEWTKRATIDLDQIDEWWEPNPERNIGIVCGASSNLVVLDVDVKNDVDGLASLKHLEAAHGKIHTLTARTPSGGLHLYFQHPGAYVPSKVKVLPGLDIRADGGYIIAPPSSIAGTPYSWLVEAPLAPCPPWLVQLAAKAAAKNKLLSASVTGKIVHAGERNDTLMRLAGSLRRHGAVEQVILSGLLAYNDAQCSPPLPAAEVGFIAKSISKYAPMKTSGPNGMTAAELMEKDVPEPTWVVPGLLPAGLTLLAGKPKIGKSWLALGLAVAVSTGVKALGKIPVGPSRVLCLCLEDNQPRLQKRLKSLLGDVAAPTGLDLYWQWNKFAHGGIQDIETWLATHPEANMIVIDTLARVRKAPKGNGNLYHEDYEAIAALKHIADSHGLAILAVHHTRKAKSDDPFEMISGTTGITGAADTNMVLYRGRGTADALLHTVGRDVQESELALAFDKGDGSWRLLGDAASVVSKDRQKILNTLKAKPMGPKEISTETGISVDSVKKLLVKLVKDALVNHPKHGLYELNHKLSC